MRKTPIYILFITIANLSFTFKSDAINFKKDKTKLDCQKQLLGVFEYTYPEPGKINVSDVKIIYTKDKVYTFRKYPNFYFVECIEWVDDCTYKAYKCEFHDPILDEKNQDTSIAVEQFTKIVGNKFYFKRYRNQTLINEDFIRKTSNDVPAEFQ